MSTSVEGIRPGIAWNATRAASVLMVVIIAAIVLIFWSSFQGADPEPLATRSPNRIAAPHEPTVVDGEACVQCLP
ncbi:MAG: hypothetical protein ACRDG8_12905 [Actinomycetota bacterium]